MLNKIPLKRIPDPYKFEYLRSYNRLIEIKESLSGFYPKNQSEEQWTRLILKEYYALFTKINFISEKVYNL